MIDMQKSHNGRKNLMECRAKATLETIYPNEFSGLNKCEKPDWVAPNDHLGVEVVQATNEKFRHGKALFTNILSGEKITDANKKYVNEIKRLGQHIQTLKKEDGYYVFAHSATVSFDKSLLLKVIGEKIERINKSSDPYKTLAYLGLYVISPEASLPEDFEEVKGIGDGAYELQYGKERQFAELFLEDGRVIYRYDLRTKILKKHSISISLQKRIWDKASLESKALSQE